MQARSVLLAGIAVALRSASQKSTAATAQGPTGTAVGPHGNDLSADGLTPCAPQEASFTPGPKPLLEEALRAALESP